eukprot:NODE_88_length_2721_cov_68.846955_g84_i0.p1 GENE.NODE_88_length_2721_cov_68.846955_g84_i0~~NODE_88_length_2721_cov_68.846955_g84_i0.p1  ORF type:complete len:515 (+),score=75.29 NODE_88_length_2721_cov_68.846955_g84_i0:87-1631(+)
MYIIPPEVLDIICQYLSPYDLARYSQTHTLAYDVADADYLWEAHCKDLYILGKTVHQDQTFRQLFGDVIPSLVVIDPGRAVVERKKGFWSKILPSKKKPRQLFGGSSALSCCTVFPSLLKALSAPFPKGLTPTFMLFPGTYDDQQREAQGLVIERDCHLVAASDEEDRVQISSLARFTKGKHLTCHGVHFTGGVELSGPTVHFHNCHFSGKGLLATAGSNHLLSRCLMADTQSGLQFRQESQGTAEHCEFTRNTHCAVEFASPQQCRAVDCQIHANGHGVVVTGNGNAEILRNDVHSNIAPGITIKANATAVVSENKVHDGHWGIVIKENGSGTISHNDCHTHRHSGVCLQTTDSPVIINNRIHDERRGVVVTGKAHKQKDDGGPTPADGRPRIEDNEFQGNTRSAISVKNAGQPIIRGNRIFDGRWGVVVQKDGAGIIENNEIHDNIRPGIGIKTGGNPTVRQNQIHHGGAIGLICNDGGEGVIEYNTFYDNKHSACVGLERITRIFVRSCQL